MHKVVFSNTFLSFSDNFCQEFCLLLQADWLAHTGMAHTYLLAELPGWADNHGNGTIPWLELLLIHDVDQHWPDEGSCFPTSSLGYPNHVSAT